MMTLTALGVSIPGPRARGFLSTPCALRGRARALKPGRLTVRASSDVAVGAAFDMDVHRRLGVAVTNKHARTAREQFVKQVEGEVTMDLVRTALYVAAEDDALGTGSSIFRRVQARSSPGFTSRAWHATAGRLALWDLSGNQHKLSL